MVLENQRHLTQYHFIFLFQQLYLRNFILVPNLIILPPLFQYPCVFSFATFNHYKITTTKARFSQSHCDPSMAQKKSSCSNQVVGLMTNKSYGEKYLTVEGQIISAHSVIFLRKFKIDLRQFFTFFNPLVNFGHFFQKLSLLYGKFKCPTKSI